MKRCVLCGIGDIGHGHNAQPLKAGRCCENCNYTVVVPHRLNLVIASRRGEEE